MSEGVQVVQVLPGVDAQQRFPGCRLGSVQATIEIRDRLCPMGRMGEAWDVAYAVLFLASDEAKYITGTQLVVDGGLTCTCVSPRWED